jgi:hypothetical protein
MGGASLRHRMGDPLSAASHSQWVSVQSTVDGRWEGCDMAVVFISDFTLRIPPCLAPVATHPTPPHPSPSPASEFRGPRARIGKGIADTGYQGAGGHPLATCHGRHWVRITHGVRSEFRQQPTATARAARLARSRSGGRGGGGGAGWTQHATCNALPTTHQPPTPTTRTTKQDHQAKAQRNPPLFSCCCC